MCIAVVWVAKKKKKKKKKPPVNTTFFSLFNAMYIKTALLNFSLSDTERQQC